MTVRLPVGRGGQDRRRRPPGVDAAGRVRARARRRRSSAWAAAPPPTSPGSWPRPTTAASPGSPCRRRSSGMVDAAIGGKTGIDLPSAKNAVGAVPPARVGGVRPGRARDPARARVGVRLRRGDQDRAPGRRPAVGDGARLGAGPGHARAAARADPPLRGLQGADRRRGPDRARPPRGAEPGPLDRPRHRGRDRLQGVRARRGGRHRPALGAVALGPDARASTRPSRTRCATCCAGTACRWPRATSARRPSSTRCRATRRPAAAASGSRSWPGSGSPVWDCDPGDDLIETAVARAVAHRG